MAVAVVMPPGTRHFINYGIVDLLLGFLHAHLSYCQRSNLSVYIFPDWGFLLMIYSTFMVPLPISTHIDAFHGRCKAGNGGVSLGINADIVDENVVVYFLVVENYFLIFKQIRLKGGLLSACPCQRKAGCKDNICLDKLLGFSSLAIATRVRR